MTSLKMTSYCLTSRCGVYSLLGLCISDCSINMLNFNKLRFIVFEIFDNSQLFLTDPRIPVLPQQEGRWHLSNMHNLIVIKFENYKYTKVHNLYTDIYIYRYILLVN